MLFCELFPVPRWCFAVLGPSVLDGVPEGTCADEESSAIAMSRTSGQSARRLASAFQKLSIATRSMRRPMGDLKDEVTKPGVSLRPIPTSASGVNSALANGVGNTIDGQHVRRNPVIYTVRFGIAHHVIE